MFSKLYVGAGNSMFSSSMLPRFLVPESLPTGSSMIQELCAPEAVYSQSSMHPMPYSLGRDCYVPGAVYSQNSMSSELWVPGVRSIFRSFTLPELYTPELFVHRALCPQSSMFPIETVCSRRFMFPKIYAPITLCSWSPNVSGTLMSRIFIFTGWNGSNDWNACTHINEKLVEITENFRSIELIFFFLFLSDLTLKWIFSMDWMLYLCVCVHEHLWD